MGRFRTHFFDDLEKKTTEFFIYKIQKSLFLWFLIACLFLQIMKISKFEQV